MICIHIMLPGGYLPPDGAGSYLAGRRYRLAQPDDTGWQVSSTMDVQLSLEAVQKAVGNYGVPEVFNTCRGSRFTGLAFAGLHKQHGIRISTDGKGYWLDKVFVERLWRTIKYKEVYPRDCDSVSRAGASREGHNTRRPHSRLDRMTPGCVYFKQLPQLMAA